MSIGKVHIIFAITGFQPTCIGLALVDVGGLVASTILALLMLPIYYEVMSPKKKPEPHYD